MRVFAALALVLLLAGCVPTPPAPSPTPEASSTPVFATEEEALAAAEEAYAAYQTAVDDALSTLDAAELAGVATDAALQAAEESVASFAEKQQRQVGQSRFDTVSLAQHSEPLLQIYAC
ncbi:MAG TPA: hypothetical protein VN200_08420, partial [Rhodoglobus sp.]|nr:hypothetical protein [Rhodoglobus sp.]